MQTESKAGEILSKATKDLSRVGFLKYLGVISEAVANVNAAVLVAGANMAIDGLSTDENDLYYQYLLGARSVRDARKEGDGVFSSVGKVARSYLGTVKRNL